MGQNPTPERIDLECAFCGVRFSPLRRCGPVPKFCARGCREKAYRSRLSFRDRSMAKIRRRGSPGDEFDRLMSEQDGRCRICQIQIGLGGLSGDALCVDHCHTTGEFRGLICGRCNTGLGQFRDNTDHLLAAAYYLLRHVYRNTDTKCPTSS